MKKPHFRLQVECSVAGLLWWRVVLKQKVFDRRTPAYISCRYAIHIAKYL